MVSVPLGFSGPNILNAAAVGFLPKHAGSRRERLAASANEARTQIFYVPPHKLSQFVEETSSVFGDSRHMFYHLNIIEFMYILSCAVIRERCSWH